MWPILLSISLFGCGPDIDACGEPLFVTRCGMRYEGSGFAAPREVAGWTDENIQLAEDATIFAGLVTCEQIGGYKLFVHPAGPWHLPDGRYVAGVTYCKGEDLVPRIEVAGTFFDVHGNAIAHELHHVGQRCANISPVDPGLDAQHGDWNRTEAYVRINNVEQGIHTLGRYLMQNRSIEETP